MGISVKIDRLIGILSVLLQEDKITVPELAERFEVSRRTINRDIEDLCKSGIPITTTQGIGGGISRKDGDRMDNIMHKGNVDSDRDVIFPTMENDEIFPDKIKVKAVFDASLKWHLIEECGVDSYIVLEDGNLLFEGMHTDDGSIIAWMLSLGDNVTLLEPEYLRKRLYDITFNLAKRYKTPNL